MSGRALTARSHRAELPVPALIGHIRDDWPAAGALNPDVSFLRRIGEDTPERLFLEMQRAHFRPLQSMAHNTQRAYASDWRVWVRFCQVSGFTPMPASPRALETFIEYSLEYSPKVPYKYVLPESPRRNRKVSVVERALAAIAKVHAWLQLPNPAAHPDVRATWRLNARGRPGKRQKDPVAWETVEKVLPTYDDQVLKEQRAAALTTTQWSAAVRRSELVAIRVEDLKLPPGRADGTVKIGGRLDERSGHLLQPRVTRVCGRHGAILR